MVVVYHVGRVEGDTTDFVKITTDFIEFTIDYTVFTTDYLRFTTDSSLGQLIESSQT